MSEQREQLQRIKKGIAVAVSISLLSIILILIFTIDRRTVASLKSLNIQILSLIVVLLIVSWITEGAAIKLLVSTLGKRVRVLPMTGLFLAGNFMGLITPFSSGAIPAQIYLLTREGLTTAEATAVSTTRALLSSWFFGVLGPIIFIFFSPVIPSNLLWREAFGGIFGVLLFGSLLLIYFLWDPGSAKRFISWLLKRRFLKRIFGKERLERKDSELSHLLDNLHSDFLMLKKRPLIVMAAMLSVAISWIAILMIAPLTLIGLGWVGNYVDLFFREFLVFFLIPASPTPGGSGTAEVTLGLLLISLVPKSLLGISVVLWRFFTYYVTMIVGGFLLLRKLRSEI